MKNEKNKNIVKPNNNKSTAGPIRTGPESSENKNGKENPFVLIEDLRTENEQLRMQLRQLAMDFQRVVTRVNRIESYQVEMDVYLRNHSHTHSRDELDRGAFT